MHASYIISLTNIYIQTVIKKQTTNLLKQRIFYDFVLKYTWPMGCRLWTLDHKVSLLTFKYIFHMTPRFVSLHRINRRQIISSQEATACFTSPSAANRLRNPKRWKSLCGSSRTLGSAVHSLSGAGSYHVKMSADSLGPNDGHFCGPLKKYLAGKRFAADDEEKQSTTSSLLTLTPIYSKADYKPWCHGG